MIDEKKIEEAAKEYAENSGFITKDCYKVGFKAGINWFLDNLWHPMSESPKMGSEILIKINKKIYEGSGINPSSAIVHEYDHHDDWESYSNDARFSKWMYIDDLLKGWK